MNEFLNINKSNKTIDLFVYTDGACIHNGKPHAKAGMGVFFGYDDPRNISKKDIHIISEISEVTINKCYKKLDGMKNELIPKKIMEKYKK